MNRLVEAMRSRLKAGKLTVLFYCSCAVGMLLHGRWPVLMQWRKSRAFLRHRASNGWCASGKVASAPQVPAGDGAEGTPFLPAPEEDVRLRQIGGFDGATSGKALEGKCE